MPTYTRHRLEDPKLDAFLRCLFYRDPRWIECGVNAEVVFTRICTLAHMGYDDFGNPLTQHKNRTIVVLDYQDWWSRDWIGDADIKAPKDFGYTDAIANGNKIVYLKLQINDPGFYEAYQSPSMVVLSCPLLLGGGRRWIGCPDGNTEYLFENQITPPDPSQAFEYDVSFINSVDSMPWRAAICDVLEKMRPRYATFFTRGTRHELAEKATVPLRQSLAIHRRSRINISSNGAGMWCLKDGELFNNGCFILREHHANISLNPLTPKFGVHWDSFRLETLPDKVDYWLSRESEMNDIRAAGYDYFRQGIYGGWAKIYTDRMVDFLGSHDPTCFGDLLVRRA